MTAELCIFTVHQKGQNEMKQLETLKAVWII